MPPDFETLSPVSETNGPDFETLAPVDATPAPAPAKPENPARQALAEGLKRDRSVGGFLRAETATISALEGLAQGTARAPATLANLPFQAIGALFPRGHGPLIAPEQVKEGYSQLNEALHPAGLPPSNPTEAEKGAGDFAAEMVSGATTPENVLAMVTPAAVAKLAPAISPAVNQVVGRLFQGQMLAGIPEGLQRLGEAKGTSAQVKEGLNVAAGALIPAVIEKSFRSGLLPKAAKSADEAVREASGKAQEAADPAKTPAEGETTQGDPATEQGDGVKTPLLSTEDQAYLDAERKAMDTPVEVIPEPTPGADDPFARSRKAGQFMGIDRAKGTIQIYSREFGEWLKSVPEKQRSQAIRSRLAEERNHLAVTPEQAAAYWDTLTAAEKAIETRQYTGDWKGRPDISGTDMGFEAIRRRMQRLADMPTSEIAESALRERWTLQGLDALSSTIRTVRETLGTSASKEGLAILDRVQGGVDVAKGALASQQQSDPGAIKRFKSEHPNDGAMSAIDDFYRNNPKGQEQLARHIEVGDDIKKILDDDGYLMVASALEHNPSDPVSYLKWRSENYGYPEKYQAAVLRISKALYRFQPNPEVIDDVERWISSQIGEPASKQDLQPNEPAAIRRGKKSEDPAQAGFDLAPVNPGEAPERSVAAATPDGNLPLSKAVPGTERAVNIDIPEEARRLKITPVDIDWGQPGQQGAYRPISDEEAGNAQALGKILTADARIQGSELSVSTTRRLTVLLDKSNGSVHIVSTYPHGRSGAMMVNPERSGAARPNSPIADLLGRYKPLYSILRDSPVKNFHQRFDSYQDYEARFGDEAHQRSTESLGKEATASPGSGYEASIPPEFPGGLGEGNVPTDADLKSFHDFFEGEIPQTKYDFDKLIGGAAAKATRQMVNAVHKAFLAEEEANPEASPEANVESALSKLYEDLKNSDTRQGFIKTSRERLRQGMAQSVQERALADDPQGPAPSQTAKDLTLSPSARKGVPAGPVEPAPPGPPADPGTLRPEDLANIKERAAGKFPPRWPKTLYRQLGERQVPKERYTMGKDTPLRPEEEPPAKPEQQLPGHWPEGDNPAAIARKAKEAGEDKFHKVVGQISGMFARHSQKQELSRLVDVADTIRVTTSQEARRAIEQPSSSAKQKHGNPEILRAARAINASYYVSQAGGQPIADRLALPGFRRLTDQGAAKARQLIASPTPATMAALGLGDITGVSRGEILGAARKWLQAATELGKEVDVAIAKFGQADLMGTTKELRNEFRLQLQRERAAGRTVSEAENYLPGLYEGEIYGDHSVTFGDITLGKSYGKPKTFKNVYEAIDAGPYIPKLNNVADSASVRIRAGMGGILRDSAFKAPLGMADPVSGSPVAIEAELSPKGGYQVPGGNLQYKLVYPEGGGKPLAVRRGYAKLVEDLFGKSGIADWTGGKALMRFGAIEKHTTLAMDLYHLSKMMWYAMAVTRSRTGYRGAHTALEFRPGNMAEAVRRGVISQKDMDWAMQRHTVTLDGSTQALTNQQLLREFQRTGLNVGRVQDAMYKHFVDSLDIQIAGRKIGIGSYNHFLFDQWTRGFMGNTAVMEFLRQHQAAPNIDARVIMKRIAGDINTQFGSVGKQSIVKNATLRDLGQLTFLAAQWTGSRISTESKFLSRLATTPYVLATKGSGAANVHFGSIGRGVGTGLVTMLALTQAINLFTRRQFTWQNPEEDHKLDAFVPDMAGGPGHWVSPLSVFLEMTHDVSRYMASGRKNLMETINQIGQNKLAPIGRAVGVLASGYTPMGQKITSTSGRFAEAGKALIPAPITISSAAREIGHQAAPGTVSPNPPGALNRQLLSSIGVKSENQASNASQMAGLAKDWMKAQGLEKETGWMQIQTDEPGYTKLRQALRADDKAKATQQIEELRKSRSDAAIKKAMQTWAKRGFTGSKKTESLFLRSLTDQQADVYYRAMDEKQGTLAKFEDFLGTLP